MKKLLTFFLTALLAFAVGWAETKTDVITAADLAATGTTYVDFSGVTISGGSDAVYAGSSAKSNAGAIQLTNSNRRGIVSTTSGGKVKSVTIQVASGSYTIDVYGSTTAYTGAGSLYETNTQGTVIGSLASGASGTITVTGDYDYVGIRSRKNAVYISSITIVWETSSSSVAAPTITPTTGTFLSTQQVTITHPDNDASIYYTLDGTDPTTSSTRLSYSGTITISSTTTVKAVAVKGSEHSSVTSETFTKVGVANIAEAYGTATGFNFTFTGNAVVTYQSPDGRYLFIRDSSKSGLIYSSSSPGTFSNGDILDVNWTANNTMYGSIPQFTSPSGLNSSANGGTVAPFDHTTDGITADNVNEYVSFSNVTLSWSSSIGYCYFTVGSNTIYLRDYFNNGLSVSSGKTYDIEGIAYINNNNVFVYLTKVTEIASTTPTLEVNPSTLTINDSGTGNTFTVNGSYLGTDNVGVTQTNNNFTPTLSATTGTTYDGGSYRGFTPAGGSVNGTVAMSYTGRELYASNTVTLSNNLTSATVTVNYIADLYIVTDNGVTGDWHFDGTYGVPMTYNNGVYSAAFTVNNPNTYILFARKTGEGVTWNTRYVFGPNSSGDWELPSSGNGGGSIDLNDDDPIKIQGTGTYIITINANTGDFSIEKEVVNTGDFVLVTDISELEMGNEVIIVNSGSAGSARTMGQRNNDNYYGTAVEVSANKKVTATAATQIFTLEQGTGGWYFKTSDGLYLNNMNSGNNNNLQTKEKDANGTGTSLAVITIGSDNAATIVFQGSGSRKYLRYNANGIASNPSANDIFSCYQYATSQADVYIYQRSATIEPSITVDPSSLEFVNPADGTPQSQNVTVTEENTTGTTSVSITGTGAANYSATLENGTLTVTYSGTATQANPDVATITLTNDEATATVDVTGYKLPVTLTITPADGHTFQGSTVSGMIESNVASATIEYSLDGTTWQTYDANEGFTATVNTVGGTVTVYARTTVNGETATAQATYTRIAKTTTCTADIVFAPTSNNGSPSDLQDVISEGRDYVSSEEAATISAIYNSSTYSSLRFGSSSNIGYLAIPLNLANFQGGQCKINRVIINAARYSNDTDCQLNVSTDVDTEGITLDVTASETDFADYVFSFTDHSPITSLRIANMATSKRVYVHSITIEYNCGSAIEAPVIEPASGTYYAGQTVTITDATSGSVIYYTTDGTDPTTSSTQYNGSFTVPYVAGDSTTIKAIAVVSQDGEQMTSDPASVTYTWGVPTVSIVPASGLVAASSVTVAITATPAEATIYYTTDGSDPTTSDTRQLYENSFNITLDEVGDEVTVQAVAVVGNLTGAVASETYTRVAKIIDVNAPFFSPLQNQIYYGDQTLQMGCTTPNADIHYEIIEVSGEEAPNAAYVNNPNNVSTVYTQPINMREGYSYYVKAIAYVGDFHSTISEGWYTVKSFSDFQAEHAGDGYTYVANCAEFNALTTTGADVSFTNPVQVVYHSTYTNNGIFAEYCYVRDNTGYACIYFGKRDDSGKTIFKMGDWINGYYIAGEMNIWENNFHNQLGTNSHAVEYWPSSTLGWSEIIPTTTTCLAVSSGTTDGDNLWGNYVHLRNTTLSEVHDYNTSDPKHTGTITDASGSDTYYDKFYLWSAGTCSYNGHNDVIQHKGDYDQAFFTAKQEAGATFDVYGIVDYYKPYEKPFEICPIDFLWIYQPVITVPSNDQCTAPFTTTITVAQPEWTDIVPTIYYKTNEMEDWEEYTPGQLISISSTTTVMTYAEVPAQKTDGTNYNDYLRSLTETATYVFPAVKDPMITPPGETYDLNVTSSVDVTVQTNPESSTGTVTYYTLDGSDPRTSETRIELTSDNGTFTVSENTTVNAASCLEMNGNTIWSNVVSETYQFIENDDKVYDLLKTAPVVGNIYVIVNKADNVGLSTTQNATNRAATGVMYVDANTKEQVKGNTHLATFVLEAATAGRYYFRGLNTHDYLCVNTNANPNLVTDARGSYAEATVTVNSGITSGVDESYPATVMMSYDGTRRYMRYYSAGRTFTTYDAATTNQDIFLYGLAPAELLPPSITPGDQLVQVVTGDEHVDATISTNYGDASTHTVYTTDGSDPRYSSTAVELDDPAIILGYINTNTTVRAASYIEYEGDVIWSEPVKATYTFIGIKEPTITPASGLFVDGTTVNVTITTNPQNTQEGVQTYYTTDGTDPRTNGTLINGNSTTLPVTGNTTVQAASCVVVDGQTLWSIVVSETYEFTTPTPLCDIEKTGVKNNDYIVADELIGAWAVCDGNTKLLWAKDKDYPANDLRPGKTTNQGDYVKELLKYQNDPWDESNWVVLDMSGVTMSPEDLVGQTIKPATIVGKYTDDVNYTIKLSQNPTPNGAVDDKNYTGWTENFEPVGKYYDRSYNTYVPANFMAEGDAVNNLNRIDDETKFVVGAVAGDFALAGCQGDSLYFVNPKIQEVARIWGVWNGNDQFTIYEVGRDTVNSKVTNINAWDIKGCFNVVWDYNRVDLAYDYHKPNHLVIGEAYEFHAAIRKPVSANGSKRTKPVPDSETDPSSNYEVYPLDMSEDPVPTAVREALMPKTVIGVTYFNLMGQESSHPYEGINIVVTRYSDGSTSAVKVLR